MLLILTKTKATKSNRKFYKAKRTEKYTILTKNYKDWQKAAKMDKKQQKL